MLLHLLLFACSSEPGTPSEGDPAARSVGHLIEAGQTGAALEKATEKIALEARKKLDALPEETDKFSPLFLKEEVAEVRRLVETLQNQIEQAAKELRIEKE